MRKTILLAVVFLGCGGGTADPAEALTGKWIATLDAACVEGANFDSGVNYTIGSVCDLADGTVGVDSESGTYSVSGGRLTTVATMSSCPNPQKVSLFSYTVSSASLRISAAAAVYLFTRNNPPPTNGTASYGCWESDGLFHSYPNSPVP